MLRRLPEEHGDGAEVEVDEVLGFWRQLCRNGEAEWRWWGDGGRTVSNEASEAGCQRAQRVLLPSSGQKERERGGVCEVMSVAERIPRGEGDSMPNEMGRLICALRRSCSRRCRQPSLQLPPSGRSQTQFAALLCTVPNLPSIVRLRGPHSPGAPAQNSRRCRVLSVLRFTRAPSTQHSQPLPRRDSHPPPALPRTSPRPLTACQRRNARWSSTAGQTPS